MKSYKTTIIGLGLAIFMAVQPIFEGESVSFDRKLVCRILIAAMVAVFGYYAKDHDVTGK
jgi:hypothetical protein